MDDLVVKSKVREYAKGKNIRLSGETFDALTKIVAFKLDKAIERAKGNGRKTVKGYDL